jgi:4-amino-4-deoxy-L-arabinose transferase-like glycosyltransferase
MIARREYGWLGLAAALVVWHVANQWVGTFGLMFDEAQYWLWGKLPDWGYFSKPPMIAWLMGASTALFGNEPFGVKLLAPLLHAGTATMVWHIARRLYDSRAVAWACAVGYLSLPVITVASAFFSTDTPLLFFWSVGLLAWLHVREVRDDARWWLVLALALAGGMLSKYTMVLFGACVLLDVLRSRQLMPLLRQWQPWAALALALLLFSPNIAWNMHHQFATLAHTQDNVFSKSLNIYPEDMAEFIGAQAITLGPVIFMLLGALAVRPAWRMAHAGWLACFIWPVVLGGVAVSLVSGAQAHWIAPAYVAIVLWVVPVLVQRFPKMWAVVLVLHVVFALLFYQLPTRFSYWPPVEKALDRVFVWNRLQSSVRHAMDRYPNARVISDERKIAAALSYQLRDAKGAPYIVYKFNPTGRVQDHYDILSQSVDFRGQDLLLITRGVAADAALIAPHAERLWEVYLGDYRFEIILIPHFKGYSHE